MKHNVDLSAMDNICNDLKTTVLVHEAIETWTCSVKICVICSTLNMEPLDNSEK